MKQDRSILQMPLSSKKGTGIDLGSRDIADRTISTKDHLSVPKLSDLENDKTKMMAKTADNGIKPKGDGSPFTSMVDFQGKALVKGEEYVTLWSNDGVAFTIKVKILNQSPTFERMLNIQLRDRE